MKKIIVSIYLVLSYLVCYAQPELPEIRDYNGVRQLIVNKTPYIMLSGELHNSSSSSLEYMKPVWGKLKQMHLNTVIATVSWELFEPEEGAYNYTLVEGLVREARRNDLKLVFIWFGTWKNGWSTYVPAWVKKDMKRFPRMQSVPGKNITPLSPFGVETMKADAGAFAELMRFIKKIDGAEQTVLMMQVQNETGARITTRDRSPLAEQAFHQPVPEELLGSLRRQKDELTPELRQMMQHVGNRSSGTWQEMFGYGADEVFMAWHISRYIECIAKAGKAAYPLPMYANAWLDPSFSKDVVPDYPSGGPVSKMLNVWRAGAPSIDLLAPDIYLDDFKRVCAQYAVAGNPLFIPEANPDVRSAANVYYALGQYNAICFAPFAIDGFKEGEAKALGESYGSLAGFLPFWANHSGKGKNVGFTYVKDGKETFILGPCRIEVQYTQQRDKDNDIPESCGLIMQVAPYEYYLTGRSIRVTFHAQDADKGAPEILSMDDGEFVHGVWQPGRRMNGDEMYIHIGNRPEWRHILLHQIK
jgi:hypothetical protein